PTSHTAIVARSLGLPAVVRCEGATHIADATPIAVDGTTGRVEVGVDEAAIADTRHREQLRRQQLSRSSGPGRTADGHPVARAAQATGGNAWVMAPMVATAAEAADFVAACRMAGLPTAGVMVEIPAAALRADTIVPAVDFLSIGTNDLSQYTFAADRQCGDLADLLDPWQPALLQLIAACTAAGKAAGKPVSVCGEAAADPALAPVLVGLGVSSLSMSARAIPAVRESLAAHTPADCQRPAHARLAAADAGAARE